MQTNYDTERRPQQGQKDHAGSSPELIRIWTQDAVGNTFCTTLERWEDEPFTVSRRTKKANVHGQPNPRTKRVTPKITNAVAEILDEMGVEYETGLSA